jgi:hypothetical protein
LNNKFKKQNNNYKEEIELLKHNNETDVKNLSNNLKLKDKTINELNQSIND